MRGLATAIAAIFIAGGAAASSVTVQNAGFEEPELGTNGFSMDNGNTPEWSVFGDDELGGAYRFIGSTYTSGLPSGDQVGYLAAGVSMYQALGITVAAETDYTLSAWIGDRSTTTFAGGFAGFAVGTGPSFTQTFLTAVADPGDSRGTVQSFTTTAAELQPHVGADLYVLLTTEGNSDGAIQTTYDDIAVTATGPSVVPLPAAVWMLLGAVGALTAISARRSA